LNDKKVFMACYFQIRADIVGRDMFPGTLGIFCDGGRAPVNPGHEYSGKVYIGDQVILLHGSP
jgi:hypothetical protein